MHACLIVVPRYPGLLAGRLHDAYYSYTHPQRKQSQKRQERCTPKSSRLRRCLTILNVAPLCGQPFSAGPGPSPSFAIPHASHDVFMQRLTPLWLCMDDGKVRSIPATRHKAKQAMKKPISAFSGAKATIRKSFGPIISPLFAPS